MKFRKVKCFNVSLNLKLEQFKHNAINFKRSVNNAVLSCGNGTYGCSSMTETDFKLLSLTVLESDRPDPELTPAEIKFVPEQMYVNLICCQILTSKQVIQKR